VGWPHVISRKKKIEIRQPEIGESREKVEPLWGLNHRQFIKLVRRPGFFVLFLFSVLFTHLLLSLN